MSYTDLDFPDMLEIASHRGNGLVHDDGSPVQQKKKQRRPAMGVSVLLTQFNLVAPTLCDQVPSWPANK